MTPQWILAAIILGIILFVSAWDMIRLVRGSSGDSVWSIARAWGRTSPLLPFVCGVIVGHIFW